MNEISAPRQELSRHSRATRESRAASIYSAWRGSIAWQLCAVTIACGSPGSRDRLPPPAVAHLLEIPHAYALGSLADLRSEILVWDGTVFTSRVERGEVRVHIDAAATAPFLIWSHVEAWKTVDLPDGSVVDHETHKRAKHLVPLVGQPVQLLGFHAIDAQGVYTHHTTHLHLHLRTVRGDVMGPVDELMLAPGAVVEIAVRRDAPPTSVVTRPRCWRIALPPLRYAAFR